MMSKPKIIVVTGPTASGKSAVAVELALALDGEVVSADSLQVYRQMDIGTAKPTAEEMKGVPHHMIDVVDPDGEFSAADFRDRASEAIEGITGRGRCAIVAGGTGLYIRALTRGLADTPKGDPALRRKLEKEAKEKGNVHLHEKLKRLDPVAAAKIHPNNRVRVIRAMEVAILRGDRISEMHKRHRFGESPFHFMMLGIETDRETLYGRIEKRVDRMIAAGLEEEVRLLLKAGYGRDLKPMGAVGYREMCAHILDGVPLDRTIELIKRNSRRYAKRQMTWLRKENVLWRPPEWFSTKDALETMRRFLGRQAPTSARSLWPAW